MKHQLTYAQLHILEQDMHRVSESPAIKMLFYQRIKQFNHAAKDELYLLHTGMDRIKTRYIKMKDNKFLISETDKKEWDYYEEVEHYKTKEILTGEAVKKTFNAEAEAFMNRIATIIF